MVRPLLPFGTFFVPSSLFHEDEPHYHFDLQEFEPQGAWLCRHIFREKRLDFQMPFCLP